MGDSSSSFNNGYQDNFTDNTNAQNINADIDNLTHTNDTDATINNLLNRNNFTARDHLFQAMFSRIALTYDRTFPPFARRFIEFMLLLTAISVLFILIYIHMAFVKAPITCLDHLTFNENTIRDVSDGSVKQMVIRVEVLSNPPSKYSLYNSYSKEYDDLNRINQSEPLETSKLLSNERFSRLMMFLNIIHKQCHKNSSDVDNRHLKPEEKKLYMELNKNGEKHSDKSSEGILYNLFNFPINPILEKAEYWREKLSVRAMAPFRHTFNELELFAKSVFTEEKYIMEYSLEYGLLRLTPQTRERLNIPVHFVLLDANKDQCFGNGISRFLLQEFVGYDQIIIGSLKRLAERQNGKGYVRNVVSGEHYRFVNSWMSRTSYLAAGFIMIIFTLSVSMLLRYSHHQIFVFIVDLLRMLENNLQFSFPAAPLLTVVLALVGMEAIMSEFFNDTSTAFYTILIIWLADQYEAVCCRTYVSKRHWPKYFYLYHFAFYAYHYRFNGQFSGLALLCSWLFIQHSMFFFFHHYELPRLMHGIAVRAIMDSIIVERTENRSRTPTSMFPNDDDIDRSGGDRNDRDHEDPEPSSAMPSMAASGETIQETKGDNQYNNEGEQNPEENQQISNDYQSNHVNLRLNSDFNEFIAKATLYKKISPVYSSNQKHYFLILAFRSSAQANIRLLIGKYQSRTSCSQFKHNICPLHRSCFYTTLFTDNMEIDHMNGQVDPHGHSSLQLVVDECTMTTICLFINATWAFYLVILCFLSLTTLSFGQYRFQSRFRRQHCNQDHISCLNFNCSLSNRPRHNELSDYPSPVRLSSNSLDIQLSELFPHYSFADATDSNSDITNRCFTGNSISLNCHSNGLVGVPSYRCTEGSSTKSNMSSPCLQE